MSDSAAGAKAPAPKLDELMMAMDVVDTLRHQEKVVAKEFAQEERDEVLKARLREIYHGQGLEVNDRVLDEGIRALKEARFTYKRHGSSWGRFWAGLWVNRRRTGLVAGVILLGLFGWIGTMIWQGYQQRQAALTEQVALTQTLPKALTDARTAALAAAKTDDARKEATRIAERANTALAAKDRPAAQEAIADLKALQGRLSQTYELRIVSRKGERTGVFRVPRVNRNARNYYIIVEPVAPDGEVLSLPILGEEDNKTVNVSKFGVRVPRETFEQIARDKRDDGIIQSNVLGRKPAGALKPQFNMTVTGGYITKW